MQYVGVLWIPHLHCMQCGSKNEAQAVDDVQPFEADGILDPWLSWLFCLQLKEDLYAYGSDHQE